MSSVIDGADNFDSGHMLGVGQTWQDVNSVRVFGITYTNNTGKPIAVLCVANVSSGSGYGGLTLNLDGFPHFTLNVIAQHSASTLYAPLSFIVPNGSTYNVTSYGTSAKDSWRELREVV